VKTAVPGKRQKGESNPVGIDSKEKGGEASRGEQTGKGNSRESYLEG